ARGALVGGPAWAAQCRIGEVSGLDLSALERFAPLVRFVSPRHGLEDALSGVVDLVRFDFSRQRRFPVERTVVEVRADRDGLAEGVLQWIRLEFADALCYEQPPPEASAWQPLLHVFARPIPVEAGQRLPLAVEHDRSAITIWPVGAS